jgi:hypothetical protein
MSQEEHVLEKIIFLIDISGIIVNKRKIKIRNFFINRVITVYQNRTQVDTDHTDSGYR